MERRAKSENIFTFHSSLLPHLMGVQLSWESTCPASRGSRVRFPSSPPMVRTDERDTPKETNMGSQLRWLERAPDKREVGGSSPLEPTKLTKVSKNVFIENRIKQKKSKKRTDKRTIKRFNLRDQSNHLRSFQLKGRNTISPKGGKVRSKKDKTFSQRRKPKKLFVYETQAIQEERT